jgi:hypothetical protein
MSETKWTPGPWEYAVIEDEFWDGDEDDTPADRRFEIRMGEAIKNRRMFPTNHRIEFDWSLDPRRDQYQEALATVRLIAAAPGLIGIVHRLCVNLAQAGVDANPDSLNPLESLHADALAIYEAATGDANPFAGAMAEVCANNRAALAKARGER